MDGHNNSHPDDAGQDFSFLSATERPFLAGHVTLHMYIYLSFSLSLSECWKLVIAQEMDRNKKEREPPTGAGVGLVRLVRSDYNAGGGVSGATDGRVSCALLAPVPVGETFQ